MEKKLEELTTRELEQELKRRKLQALKDQFERRVKTSTIIHENRELFLELAEAMGNKQLSDYIHDSVPGGIEYRVDISVYSDDLAEKCYGRNLELLWKNV